MGKGAPLRWLENRILWRHLRGCGVEIGALWRQFPLPARARVWYVDRLDSDGLLKQYPTLRGKILWPDLVAEAAQLPVAPASLDFIIASHLLEHLPFPLAALRAWYETLVPGGVLLLRVPDKRYTFDTQRARTQLAQLIEEYNHPERFDRRAHYADWVQNVKDGNPETEAFEREVRRLMEMDFSIHFHVWIDEDLREIIDYTRQAWYFDWKPVVFWGAHFYRKEVVLLLRRA
ncbi:MAG: methyltransferase domain-containing protein [Nitrospiraceae bacterium]